MAGSGQTNPQTLCREPPFARRPPRRGRERGSLHPRVRTSPGNRGRLGRNRGPWLRAIARTRDCLPSARSQASTRGRTRYCCARRCARDATASSTSPRCVAPPPTPAAAWRRPTPAAGAHSIRATRRRAAVARRAHTGAQSSLCPGRQHTPPRASGWPELDSVPARPWPQP